jgi:hypothetical protein
MTWAKIKFYYEHGLSGLTATSAVSGNEVSHMLERTEMNYWKATGTANQYISYDAGSGNTINVDYLALSGHNLSTIGATARLLGSRITLVNNYLNIIDTDDQGDNYLDAMGDGSFIYVARDSSGLTSYSFDGTTLTSVDTDDQGGNYVGVYAGPASLSTGKIFVAAGSIGTVSYSVDGSGNITQVDTEATIAGNATGVYGTPNWLYVSSDTGGLHIYRTVAGGSMAYEDRSVTGAGTYNAVYADGSIGFCACGTDGLRSYLVSAGGSPSLVDTDDQGDDYLDVHGYGTYIFCAMDTGGVSSYSFDSSGNLTFIDSDDQGGNYTNVYYDGTLLYCSTSANGTYIYNVDSSGNLTYEEAITPSGVAKGVFVNNDYAYIASNINGLYAFDVSRDLFEPEAPATDLPFVREGTSTAKRYWNLLISGSLTAAPQIRIGYWGELTELEYASTTFDPNQQLDRANINTSQTGFVLGVHTKYTERRQRFRWIDADLALYTKIAAWFAAVGKNLFFTAWEIDEHPTEVYLMHGDGNLNAPYKKGGNYRDITINLTGRKQ